jgi:hypothetical protein
VQNEGREGGREGERGRRGEDTSVAGLTTSAFFVDIAFIRPTRIGDGRKKGRKDT